MRCPGIAELPPAPADKTGWPWTEQSKQSLERRPGGKPWPIVSIVTPSYNQAQFIEETIRSVLLQQYPNLEYIVIDGGSTDGSVDIIRKYERWLAYWASEPDEGQAAAINKGFDIAEGAIVAWLNSDDAYLRVSVLREAVEVLSTHPEADVVYGDVVLLSSDNRVLKVQCTPRFHYRHLLRSCYIKQPALFLRDRVIEEHRLDPSLDFALDYELWLRLGRFYRFRHVPRLWAADRNHPGRKILAARGKMKRESRVVAQRYGYDSSYQFLHRLEYKLTVGLPTRLRGLLALLTLYCGRDKERHAIPIRLDPFHVAMGRQVCKKNKDVT